MDFGDFDLLRVPFLGWIDLSVVSPRTLIFLLSFEYILNSMLWHLVIVDALVHLYTFTVWLNSISRNCWSLLKGVSYKEKQMVWKWCFLHTKKASTSFTEEKKKITDDTPCCWGTPRVVYIFDRFSSTQLVRQRWKKNIVELSASFSNYYMKLGMWLLPVCILLPNVNSNYS